MSDEENLAAELQQTVRMLVTVGGQVGERIARLRSDEDRQQQLQAQERTREGAGQLREQQQAERQQRAQERQDLQRQMQQEVTAARSVYGGVRDGQFWRDDPRLQVRVGEALAVSEAMRPHDKLAGTAHDYLRREIGHRQGDDAGEWTAAALAAYREELASLDDRDTARDVVDDHMAQARDGQEAGDEPTVEIAVDAATVAEGDAREDDQDAALAHELGDVAEREERGVDVSSDPEAWRAAETAEQAYPVPAMEELAQGAKRTRPAARRAARGAGRDSARGR